MNIGDIITVKFMDVGVLYTCRGEVQDINDTSITLINVSYLMDSNLTDDAEIQTALDNSNNHTPIMYIDINRME